MTAAPTPGVDGPSGGSPALTAAGAAATAFTRPVSRRRFLSAAGLAAAAVPLGGALASCSGGSGGANSGNRAVRVGLVTPQTGSLSQYADADMYTVGAMNTFFRKGIQVGNQNHPVTITVRDSQSDQNRAAQAASELIFKDQVDVVLVSATADTANPVSDQCEANQVPCISTGTSWQEWFTGRGGTLAKPFTWTYHFNSGLEDLTRVYTEMWASVDSNKKVGALWPNDTDGTFFANGFPQVIGQHGFTLAPGAELRYTDLQTDPNQLLAKFQQAGTDIVTGVPAAADFEQFWAAVTASSYKPRIVTVSRALLFPTAVEALGSTGAKLSTEIGWSPNHPFHSSLTGHTALQLAQDYTSQTGKQWVQLLGFSHALFEVLTAALAAVTTLDDKAKIAQAIGNAKLVSMVGPITFGARVGDQTPVPRNVAKTPLVGGQWVRSTTGANPYDMVITTNTGNPNIHAPAAFAPLQL